MARKTPVETLDILRNNLKHYAPDFDTSNPDRLYGEVKDVIDSLDEAELVMALEEDLSVEILDAATDSWPALTLAQVAAELDKLQKDEFA